MLGGPSNVSFSNSIGLNIDFDDGSGDDSGLRHREHDDDSDDDEESNQDEDANREEDDEDDEEDDDEDEDDDEALNDETISERSALFGNPESNPLFYVSDYSIPYEGKYGLESESSKVHFISQFSDMLNLLKQREDPEQRMDALRRLSDLILYRSDEVIQNALSLSAGTIINEFTDIMENPIPGDDDTESVLLACRSLRYLVDLVPKASRFVLDGDLLPLFCKKLREIEYIDVAEQILLILKMISADHPVSVTELGALTASLQYIEFFPIFIQRAAIGIAVNCSKIILPHCVDTFCEIMPLIIRMIMGTDKHIIEQGCSCIANIVENIESRGSQKLEEIVTDELLLRILDIANPSSRSFNGHDLRLNCLKILSTSARASPTLATKIFNIDVTNVLYSILTGTEPPADDQVDVLLANNEISALPSIISLPVELLSTLSVFTELFPGIVESDCPEQYRLLRAVARFGSETVATKAQRIEMLKSDEKRLRARILIWFPLLVRIYMDSMEPAVTLAVAAIFFRLLSNIDPAVLRESLKTVKFSAVLGSMLSQVDKIGMVAIGVQIGDILRRRLPDCFVEELERDGALLDIISLAKMRESIEVVYFPSGDDAEDEGDGSSDAEDAEADIPVEDEDENPATSSEALDTLSCLPISALNAQYYLAITKAAEELVAEYNKDISTSGRSDQSRRENLRQLVDGLATRTELDDKLQRLATYFTSQAASTSYMDLMLSGVPQVMLNLFDGGSDEENMTARKAFLQVFANCANEPTKNLYFKVLVSKLQELLIRFEHFSVITAVRDEENNDPVRTLSMKIKLKLVEVNENGDETERNSTVSIPAVATFQDLETHLIKQESRERHAEIYGGRGDSLSTMSSYLRQSSEVVSCLAGSSDAKLASTTSDGSTLRPSEISFRHIMALSSRSDLGAASAPDSASESEESRPSSSSSTSFSSLSQNYRVQFKMFGRAVSNDSTIFSGLYKYSEQRHDVMSNSPQKIYPVQYRLVPKTKSVSDVVSSNTIDDENSFIEKNGMLDLILKLLKVLFDMNLHVDRIMAGESQFATPLPLTQFVNTRLSAKLKHQLDQALIVTGCCFPDWNYYIMRYYPFLIPLGTRYLFMQSTSFGYSRSLERLKSRFNVSASSRASNATWTFTAPRHKVRISRTQLLQSTIRVLKSCDTASGILEVEYFDEVGTGLGPTLEFFANASLEFASKSLHLWRDDDSDPSSKYAFSKQGLFPAPMSTFAANMDNGKKILEMFSIFGKFVGRALLDSRRLDIQLNPMFFLVSRNDFVPALHFVGDIDEQLAKSLNKLQEIVKQKQLILGNSSLSDVEKKAQLCQISMDGISIESLALDFTLPGYPDYELIEDGANVDLTIENVELYIERTMDALMGSGVEKQLSAFRTGFSSEFAYRALEAFLPSELVAMCGGSDEAWSLQTLFNNVKADHGYTMSSITIHNLLEIMADFTRDERRSFLSFVTGSPNLPIGGFRALSPAFTIVCRQHEPPLKPDHYLPSVMTCANYLKLPDYSSKEILKRRLLFAMHEGGGSFLLS
ncbi:uncharacterized protein V1518DRAFT_372191 [Limtongia smithiae]|uniref:uncharacterized protein n=1 Tax=Limtongia smithiae TaxID=1125753 RepID=UPI0034D00D45